LFGTLFDLTNSKRRGRVIPSAREVEEKEKEMYRVYLLTALGNEVVYYEGDDDFLADKAVEDFRSKGFEARIVETI
jgi:hypothetical protein